MIMETLGLYEPNIEPWRTGPSRLAIQKLTQELLYALTFCPESATTAAETARGLRPGFG
jgi:hypothetical protein